MTVKQLKEVLAAFEEWAKNRQTSKEKKEGFFDALDTATGENVQFPNAWFVGRGTWINPRENRFPAIAKFVVEELMDYGCWCTNLNFGPYEFLLYGEPVDDFDKACKNLYNRNFCIMRNAEDLQGGPV